METEEGMAGTKGTGKAGRTEAARADYIRRGFARIHDELELCMDCLGAVLESLGEARVARFLPWRGGGDGARGRLPAEAGQALSIAFQLLNMVEDSAAGAVRHWREADCGPTSERGLWGFYFERLRARGLDAEALAELLGRLRVEPVLTAHPTEAKRLSVLEQHRYLHKLLSEPNPPSGGVHAARRAEELRVALERLWRTGEVLVERPEVADELRNVLHYLVEVFPQVLEELDERFLEAVGLAGLDSGRFARRRLFPRLRFGTWVGGDRDGHPLVTAEVTRRTLDELRRNALGLVRRELRALEEKLSLSNWMQQPPKRLTEHFRIPASACRGEPWRWCVRSLIGRLPDGDGAEAFSRPEELLEGLGVLRDSLVDVRAQRLADHDVLRVERVVEVFGFHLARLDIRQNSAFHTKALGQLMDAAGLPGGEYVSEWDEARRVEFLGRELESPRPFLPPGAEAPGEEAEAVLACHRVLAEHLRRHGPSGIGALIVSMTRGLSDLLAVVVLAREAGLCRTHEGRPACLLEVVPLFETLEDLNRSPGILEGYLSHPAARRGMALRAALWPARTRPDQQVMVGYSDSTKDAGIVAGQWALHQAQARLAEVGAEQGITPTFFHGRGGTVSRGAGPTHRFLEALPVGSLTGSIRLTEQGETIAQKYASAPTAAYNLELLLAGVAGTTFEHERAGRGAEMPRAAQGLMQRMADRSRDAYRELIGAQGFIEFYRQATPIDALEQSRIGSRPSRRTGQATLEDLRAIPWVFSWTQSRFYLPGWFGAGSALEALDGAERRRLREWVRRWPFLNYLLTNVESSIASGSVELMAAYAGLVRDRRLRKRFMDWILREREWARKHINAVYGAPLERRRPRFSKTLRLREEPLRLLHEAQIRQLRQWRALAASDPRRADAAFPDLLLTINAIASGLRTTG